MTHIQLHKIGKIKSEEDVKREALKIFNALKGKTGAKSTDSKSK